MLRLLQSVIQLTSHSTVCVCVRVEMCVFAFCRFPIIVATLAQKQCKPVIVGCVYLISYFFGYHWLCDAKLNFTTFLRWLSIFMYAGAFSFLTRIKLILMFFVHFVIYFLCVSSFSLHHLCFFFSLLLFIIMKFRSFSEQTLRNLH